MPEVCSHYLRGTCKYGPRCFKQHPSGQEGSQSNNNRFGGFSGGDRYRPAQNNAQSNPSQNSTASFGLSEADIKKDIEERPLYPISCYGPGRGAPRQLIEGPVEISPEELRLRYYTLRTAGDENTAKQEEAALGTKMEQQLKAISDDIPGAIKYIEDGAHVHPNRIDIANGNASSSGTGSAFGNASAAAAANPFGTPTALPNPFIAGSTSQPSAFGQASKPGFGQPAFGQPSNPAQTTSAFGQPSNPGQNASPFGQPSNPGQNASPFGAASALGQKPSPFGQPSALGGGGAFGKPAFGASGFGQPSMPGAGNAFGQTNSVGQGSAFGQPSAPSTSSPFGQANALGQKPSPFAKPGFGQSGFGQAAQPGGSASPFGQAAQSGGASPFGQQTSSTQSPFGQPAAATPSPFGQPTQATPSPFGQPAQSGTTQASPFGQAVPKTQPAANPFQQGRGEAPGDKPSPFASAASQPSAFGQPNQPNSNPFGAPAAQGGAPQSANPFLKPQTSAQAAASSTPGFGFRNGATPQTQAQPSTTFQPQGGVPASTNIDPKERFKEGKPEEYEGEQGKMLEEIYRRVAQLGRFDENEDIPLTPPKCEWIVPMPV